MNNYCTNCGEKLIEGKSFCANCGEKIKTNEIIKENNNQLQCPFCGSYNVEIKLVSETQKRGCGSIFLYILLALTVIGIPIMILIILLRGKTTTTKKYYICKNCGETFRHNKNAPIVEDKTPITEYIKDAFKILFLLIVILSIFVCIFESLGEEKNIKEEFIYESSTIL